MNHKFSFIFLIFQFFSINVIDAQTVGIGTSSPNTSAILDLSSIVSGLLIPRMTSAQQNTIPATAGGTTAAPAIGLMLYNLSTNTINTNIGTVAAPIWSSLWGTGGDNLINSGNQFIGSTNTVGLRFRTNNLERMVIDSTTGYVGIGLPNISATNGSIPNSTLQANGSFAKAILLNDAALLGTGNSVTNITLNETQSTLLGNTKSTGGKDASFTLPTTLGISGRIYSFKNVGTGIVYIILFNSSQTIDGQATSYTLSAKQSITIQTNGSVWYIIGVKNV